MHDITMKQAMKLASFLADPEAEYHYFVSTVFHWKTGTDLFEVLDYVKARTPTSGKVPYFCFLVPLPPNSTYDIRGYAPDVEGTLLIARGEF